MDQSAEYTSVKSLLRKNSQLNLSEHGGNGSEYNFTGADDILASFRLDFHHIGYNKILLLSLYLLIFAVALVGNLLIIITLALQNVKWKAKHLYLLNLATADLLVTLFCMPSTVVTILYRLWMSGLVMCKLGAFLQGVAVATGIFTLTAMSVDRYLSIQHPSHAHWRSSPRHAALIAAVVWAASAAFMSPQLYVRAVDTLQLERLPTMTFCIERWPRGRDRQIFASLLLLVVYVIPVVIVAVCYANVGRMLCSYTLSRDDSNTSTGTYIYCRRRAARALFFLVGLFIVCWLPYNIISLLIDLGLADGLVSTLPFTLWLGHAHSAVNPVLYWATNRQFRHVASRVFKAMRCPGTGKKYASRNRRHYPRRV